MQSAVTNTADRRKVFDVLMAVTSDVDETVEVDAAPAALVEMDVAAKTVLATADGAARAPIATAMAMVKSARGPVRVKTVSIKPDMRSRSISRPRAKRCFTASSLRSSAVATA